MRFNLPKARGRWTVSFHRALIWFGHLLVAVVLGHLLMGSVLAETAGGTDEDRVSRKRKLRQERMRNDMRYGTDVFFGSNRDVWYADMTRPTPVKQVLPAPVAATDTGSRQDSSDDDSEPSSPSRPLKPPNTNPTDPPPTDPPPPPPIDPPPPPPPPPPPGGG